MRKLSTHVLDTAQGRPAAGMKIELWRLGGPTPHRLAETRTNADGRTDAPLLTGETLESGSYELVFHVAAYFRACGVPVGDPAFLNEVPIRFGVAADDAGYHVPLLCSPWAYSTYRGS
jgi:5-hydroxyisourate hydrolase